MEDLASIFHFFATSFFLILAGIWSFTYIRQAIFRSQHKTNPSHPGPRGLPLLGNLPHRSLQKLSRKYGPIMQLRLGPVPTIVVSSAEVAELFLKTHELNFARRRKMQASEYLLYGSRGLVFSEYGAYWRNLRKLCTMHLLSRSKSDSFRPLRSQEVRNLVQVLKGAAEGRQVVDIGAQVGLAVEKISYGMIFGTGYRDRFNFKPHVQEALRLIAAPNLADFFPLFSRFDLQGLKGRMKDVSKIMDEFLEKIIDEHELDNICERENHKGFISIMLSLMKSSNGHTYNLDRIDIKAMALDLVEAAMETSVSTIEWALMELLRHPKVMTCVQEELVKFVGMDRMVEETDLENLSYLNMVVKESMRLHPSSPIVPRESIDDIVIKELHITKGSMIFINAFAIGRDPNVWTDNAEEFYPERFINIDIDVRGHDIQIIPFGSGRRKCPGMEIGITTVQFVLAQLVHCFNFELPIGMSPSEVDKKEIFGVTMKKVNPLLVIPLFCLQSSSM